MRAGIVVVIAACGGGSATPDAPSRACQDMGGSACFQIPKAPMQTRDGTPSGLGCGPIVPVLAPSPVVFSGSVVSYGTNKPVPNAGVALYSTPDFATPFATTTAAADATYSITVPMGTPDVLYGKFSAAGFLDVYAYAQRADLAHGDVSSFNLRVVTSDNIESAALLVKEIWDPSAMVIAGTLLDCNRVIIQHAAVTISTTSGTRTFVPGVSLYYGTPGAVPLAALPEDSPDTNDNGAFAVFHLKPGAPLYAQAWGFTSAGAVAQGEAGLTLIAEAPLYIAANSASQMNLWAR